MIIWDVYRASNLEFSLKQSKISRSPWSPTETNIFSGENYLYPDIEFITEIFHKKTMKSR